MEVEEALAVLGLTGTPGEAETRRAYLRQVRLHPPERDAEGFRRVREAYDLLKQPRWTMGSAVATPAARVDIERSLASAPSPAPPASESVPEPLVEQDETDTRWELVFSDDAKQAADAIVSLCADPVSSSSELPPAFIVLRTFMSLVSQRELERAREMLDVFEARSNALGLGAALEGEIAGRFRLAREIEQIARFDEELAHGIAERLSAGDVMLAESEMIAARREHGRELGRYMRAHAPILWASLGSAVEPPLGKRLARSGRWGGWFPGFWLMILVNIARCAVNAGNEHPRGHESVQQPLPLPSTLSDAFSHALDPNQLGTWRSLSSALRMADCQSVREQWPIYRAEQRRAPPDTALEEARKNEVLTMCAELADLLEETP